jgi:B9 domain-containing protein 2
LLAEPLLSRYTTIAVYVMGQILGADGFPAGNKGLHCEWTLVTSSNWSKIQGIDKGHTQLDFPIDGGEAVWAHPVEIHYSVSDRVQGWPKFQLQVFQEDMFGRNELVGYGFVHVPSAPGCHELECSCWRPMSASWSDEVQAFFVGGNPQLKTTDMIANNVDRYKLQTRSSGRVSFRISVMLKGFSKHGFQFDAKSE